MNEPWKYSLEDMDIEDLCSDLFMILRNIQLVCLGEIKDPGFNLNYLLTLFLDIKIWDLNSVIEHFKDTLNNYILKCNIKEKKNWF